MRSSKAAMLVMALASTTLLTVPMPQAAMAAETSTDVTINARAGLGAVSDTAIGVNHAVWDTLLGTNEVADLMHGAGVQLMRYPGGSYGDIYHWRDNTAPGGFVAPNTDFDHFMSGVQRAGAQAMVIANYGTGSAQEAADWVAYANVDKHYGVKYWEVGNELYGNGHYGANWEADNHADKSPAAYARGVVEYAQAMKAVDPTVKIGAVLTTAANWPDGLVGGGDAGSWNQVVLSIAGPSIDFAILHWYPGGSTGPDALSKTDQVVDATWLVRQQITKYAGPGASRIGLAVTEMNTGYGQNTQPGALFAADSYATLIENGVFAVDWWNVHNGMGTVSTVGGQTDYNDFGLLSSANCNGDRTVCEPALNTPFAPYFGISMVSKFARPGGQLIRAQATDSLVKAHAARQPNGDLAVLLVNTDPDNAKSVTLHYSGYSPAAGAPQVSTFTTGATAITTAAAGSATSQTLPPYSLTTVILHPAAQSIGGPGAPGQPVAADVTARDATISWPAAPGGGKYEIHRQLGTGTEQWGETSGTSFTVHNLVPGTRYTANVVTRDASGKVSWASPPVTFVTGTPTTSDCAVRFADANDWGSGYVASVDITNTGPNPMTSWSLAFSWPTGWQQMQGGWNGLWTASGRDVKVTNESFNGSLAPGASTNIGFVAGYQGPNVLPPTFTLNGKLCTTQ